MKGRVVVLGQYRGREAAALVVDGQLQDLLIAPGDEAGFLPGAILRGTMDRPVKGMGGAFVRLPDGQKGFLRETRGLAPGRPVIVQVSGHAEPGKALPVTTRVLFKGRFAIVTPTAPGLNLSRRIREEESRARLEAIAQKFMAGSAFGLVMRSAAEHFDDDEIGDEIAVLRDLTEKVMADREGAPELLVDAPGPVELAAREWADPVPDEVAEGASAFAEHGVDAMIDALLRPTVPLPGGGHMAVEPTRALVAVDVNTGMDMTPAAALKANIAAARELPRQLRLRGLGGQIAIDFAPMPRRDRPAVEQQLRRSFKGDPTETNLAGWTPLGNFELARKRDRLPLAQILEGSAE